MYNSYVPNVLFIGCKKNNPGVKNLMTYIETIRENDYYKLLYLFKNINKRLIDLTNSKEITLLEGKLNGIKTKDNENVYINHLVEDSHIKLSKNAIGLYIPKEDLEERTHYNWITYLSKNELLNSNTFMGKLFNKHFNLSDNNNVIISENNISSETDIIQNNNLTSQQIGIPASNIINTKPTHSLQDPLSLPSPSNPPTAVANPIPKFDAPLIP